MTKDRVKTTTAVTIILLISSFALMTMQVQAQITQSGGSPSGMDGDPNLNPLPSGVTPAYTIKTTAYLSFRPNPIGVGQSLLVNMWTTPGLYHSFYMCDYKVTIEKPGGSTDVFGPINSYLGDATAWFEYVPTEVGTYRFKFEQPGTYMPAGIYRDRPGVASTTNYTLYASVYYTPSSTDWQELTVQADLVASWPPAPLPTDYWTRPVHPEFREWWPILGNYPWSGVYYYPGGRELHPSNYRYTAYVQAPNSAHIVWKRQDSIAGIIGGDAYISSIRSGGNTPEIIYAGRCYNSYSKPGSGKSAVTYWMCTDLRTGELIWERPLEEGESAPFAIEMNPPTASSSVAGAEASASWSVSLVYIGGGYLRKYNPVTGAMTGNYSTDPITSVARSGFVSPGGEYGPYLFNYEMVFSIQNLGSSVPVAERYRLITWTTRGTSNNFASRIESNISWPRSSLGAVDYDAGVAVWASWASPPGPQWCIGHDIASVDLYTGNVLWISQTNDTLIDNVQTLSSPIADRGKFAMAMQNLHWSCWDARSGRKLWDSELTEYPWGNWWPYATASYDINETKGVIISGSYAGVYAFDWDTGNIVWHYADPDVPFESPYGQTPFQSGCRIADGKVYIYNTEHSASQPATRGWKLYCLNATTGDLIWKIGSPMSPGAVADGYLTASDSYTGYMYVFGKGKSVTAVTVEPAVIAKGATVLIKGTVLDMSPAQPGTPCVSKDSMSLQMEYLHMQKSITGLWNNETITGVPVYIYALDSNDNVIDIGTATTNGYYGTFSMAWTPPNEDTYTIIASFAADDSYGSSSAATAVTVGPAPAEQPTQSEVIVPDYTMTIVYMGIAIIIAVIVAVAAAVLLLRRR